MIACGLYYIWQPSFVKIIPLVAPGILSTFFQSIHITHWKYVQTTAIGPRFPLWRIFPKILTLSVYFCHRTAIYSFSSSFISFDFGYFFYNKDFFAFHKVFSTSHIARGIIKLIAWTSSFLEERLDFEITWLIWNANNPTMPPPWPKNIHLYLKRLYC